MADSICFTISPDLMAICFWAIIYLKGTVGASTKHYYRSVLFAIGYAVTYIGFGKMVADPKSTEEQIALFFLYCTPNVVLMTIVVFLLVQKIKLSSPFWLNTFALLTKYGFGIYRLSITG